MYFLSQKFSWQIYFQNRIFFLEIARIEVKAVKKTLFTTYVDIQYETLHTIFLSNLNKYAHRKEKVFYFWCVFYACFWFFYKRNGRSYYKKYKISKWLPKTWNWRIISCSQDALDKFFWIIETVLFEKSQKKVLKSLTLENINGSICV